MGKTGAPTGTRSSRGMSDTGMGALRPFRRAPTAVLCKRVCHASITHTLRLDFSRSGKPTDNAMTEAFNARLRAECLNENRFLSLEDAREKIEGWRRPYNGERPHSALGNLAPETFAMVATTGAQ